MRAIVIIANEVFINSDLDFNNTANKTDIAIGKINPATFIPNFPIRISGIKKAPKNNVDMTKASHAGIPVPASSFSPNPNNIKMIITDNIAIPIPPIMA